MSWHPHRYLPEIPSSLRKRWPVADTPASKSSLEPRGLAAAATSSQHRGSRLCETSRPTKQHVVVWSCRQVRRRRNVDRVRAAKAVPPDHADQGYRPLASGSRTGVRILSLRGTSKPLHPALRLVFTQHEGVGATPTTVTVGTQWSNKPGWLVTPGTRIGTTVVADADRAGRTYVNTYRLGPRNSWEIALRSQCRYAPLMQRIVPIRSIESYVARDLPPTARRSRRSGKRQAYE